MGSLMTDLSMTDSLVRQTRLLIKRVVDNTDDKYGFGTLSCTVYDTAWVALVTKPVEGKRRWLFPESFQYIVSTQSEDGSWSGDTGVQIDGILNTLAGLLVLKRYRAEPLQVQVDTSDLDARISRATSALRSRMSSWDVSTTNNVGFEIIVPAMLDLLEKEGSPLVFEFKGKEALLDIYKLKMARFKPEILYNTGFMTLTHSLEALIGKIDFDKVAQHKVMGSMFASPSSTAAYLMNASTWDGEAEAYLRHSIKASIGQGSGGVPGVFPTTNFEYTWILSTLFRAGYTPLELASPELSKMKERLLETFEKANGAIGLAPGIEPDVDDSAKIVSTLNILGVPVDTQQLCEVFEVATHFRVYPGERDASFSANCNALAALLIQPDTETYFTQIDKIARFLCEKKWIADEKIEDKWNTSHLYSTFLYTEVMVDLVALTENGGRLSGLFSTEFVTRICVTLFQSSLRAILDQEENGSWGQSLEETAYAILMLTEARRLCFFRDIKKPLERCIERGVAFMAATNAAPINYIWSDKVSYGSPSLTEAYVLAAQRAASTPVDEGLVGFSVWGDNAVAGMNKRIKLFHQTPLLQTLPEWELQASMIEATIYQPLLHESRLEVLQRDDVKGGSYLMMIPFTWTSCNNRTRTHASASYLWEMMVLSFFTYQVDEFMEAVAGPKFKGRMNDLRQIIDRVTMAKPSKRASDKDTNGNGSLQRSDVEEFTSSLSKAVEFILNNSIIRKSSPYDRQTLRQELRIFLHAHTTQVEDNMGDGKQSLLQEKALSSYTTQFFRWVRTTSADHIAGAFCFYYASCLSGATLTPKTSRDCFSTTTEKYLAASTCNHLSSMCRMYNDLGSWARDRDEGNLNCIHFPEFGGAAAEDDAKKTTLLGIAQYERNRWKEALQHLKEEMIGAAPDAAAARLARRRVCMVEMFCDVTDLYGQIYVLRDISAPIRGEVRDGN